MTVTGWSSWQKETNTSKKVINDPLAVIYNEVNWKLYKVSPLYNLHYNAVKFKQYGSKIKQALVSSVASSLNIKYSVKLEVQPHLKYTEEDADGLMITVSSANMSSNTKKVVYSSLLMSWGESTTLQNATHLPYLLERGEQKIGVAVKSMLQTIFDCSIVPYNFTQNQLLQIAFVFLESDTSRDQENFSLVFTTPQVEQKDKLKISFEIEDMKLIWNGVKEEAVKPSELITLAYQMVQSQVLDMIALDVSVLDVCDVILPKAEVRSSGVVKLKTPEVINCLFLLLNEIRDFLVQQDVDQNESNVEMTEE